MQTKILFSFPDGTREPLGFIVNPLVYGYGLPLLLGLMMATEQPLWQPPSTGRYRQIRV